MEIFTYALQFLTERDAGHLPTTARGAYRTTKPFFELVSRLRLWDSGFVDVQEIVFYYPGKRSGNKIFHPPTTTSASPIPNSWPLSNICLLPGGGPARQSFGCLEFRRHF